jgi:hydroxymethylglutaryl-CoA synthase
MKGIIAYSMYRPRWRLRLGKGKAERKRAVAGPDEDSLTMAIAAARAAHTPEITVPNTLWFGTGRPPYGEKSAGALALAALGWEGSRAFDLGGSLAAGGAALAGALELGDALAALGDLRFGAHGSSDEQQGDDGAAAFFTGTQDVIAELVDSHAISDAAHDRWRTNTQTSASVWDERFALAHYLPITQEAIKAVAGQAGLSPDSFDHYVFSSPYLRLPAALAKTLGVNLAGSDAGRGYAGAADIGLKLASVLDAASPGDTILAVNIVDGIQAFAFRVTPAIIAYRETRAKLLIPAEPEAEIDILDYLTWRELVESDQGRRRAIAAPSAPGAVRGSGWKYSLTGARCACGKLNLPPQRICYSCGAVDRMTPENISRRKATVATYIVDHLAPSGRGEAIAILDFDGGGRIQAYLEGDMAGLHVGSRVSMAFRFLGAGANGVRNYFWKGILEETQP